MQGMCGAFFGAFKNESLLIHVVVQSRWHSHLRVGRFRVQAQVRAFIVKLTRSTRSCSTLLVILSRCVPNPMHMNLV